jgi:hypothetical protein
MNSEFKIGAMSPE